MILVVAHDEDETGLAVADRLVESDTPFRRIDARHLGKELWYAINPCAEGFEGGKVYASLREGGSGERGDVETFDTIYWRRPLPIESRLAMSFPTAAELSGMEAYHALRLAMEALPRSFFPLGHPVPMEKSGNKLLQLNLAKRLGFRVPDTIVGNDPEAIRDFLSRHEHVVVKPLHAHGAYSPDRSKVEQLLWCRGIDPVALMEKLDSTRPAQLLLQEAVTKRQDWRVTVLPHITICCEIDTSSLPADQPDWRKRSMDLPHSIVEVPAELDALMRRMLKELDLKAGYFDFGIGEDGEAVFFEVNTNAQWLWIERLTGYPIAEEIAKCLRREV
jgi:glutathione synthase/RimK-type ligase-like ATP-grasp enzyme